MSADTAKSHLQLDLLLTHTAPLLNELHRLGYLAPKGAKFMPLILSVHTPQIVRDRVDVGVVVILGKTLNPWHDQPVENVGSRSSGCTLRFCRRLLLHMLDRCKFLYRAAPRSMLHCTRLFAHCWKSLGLPDRQRASSCMCRID